MEGGGRKGALFYSVALIATTVDATGAVKTGFRIVLEWPMTTGVEA